MKLLLIFGALLLASALSLLSLAFGPIVPILTTIGAAAFGVAILLRRSGRAWSRAVPAALVLLLIAPGFAFAATIDVGQALTGSLQDIVNGAVAAIITYLIGWLVMTAKTKFNIDIEAKHREVLTAFVQRQASSLVADGAVRLNGVRVNVNNDTLAVAANAALQAIPGALKFFKLTPERIEGMIIDMLPKQPSVAQAQAIALDVANPATPSTPTAAAA